MKILLLIVGCFCFESAHGAVPASENLLKSLLEPRKVSEPVQRKDDFDLNINRDLDIKLKYIDRTKSQSDLKFKNENSSKKIGIRDLVDDIQKF